MHGSSLYLLARNPVGFLYSCRMRNGMRVRVTSARFTSGGDRPWSSLTSSSSGHLSCRFQWKDSDFWLLICSFLILDLFFSFSFSPPDPAILAFGSFNLLSLFSTSFWSVPILLFFVFHRHLYPCVLTLTALFRRCLEHIWCLNCCW